MGIFMIDMFIWRYFIFIYFGGIKIFYFLKRILNGIKDD